MVLNENMLCERLMSIPWHTRDPYYHLKFSALGTLNELIFSASSASTAEAFKQKAFSWLARFEARYSRFIESSLISRINREAGNETIPLDAEGDEIFSLCDWFHWRSHGVLDPTAGPLIELWGYNRQRTSLPSKTEIDQCRQRVGWSSVERHKDSIRLPTQAMRLDLGGMGKEYAVDRLYDIAEKSGIDNILIDLGHDLRVKGEPPEKGPWRIGLEHPEHPGECWGGVKIGKGAICCSGGYQRFFEWDGHRYGHIIDPRTGYPIENGVNAVWVIAPTCSEAGFLSTTAFVLGAEKGIDLIDASYQSAGCIWAKEGLYQSRRFDHYVAKNN